MNLYKKCTGKPLSFLVNNTTFPLDNPLRNLLERVSKVIVTTDEISEIKKNYYTALTKKQQKY